MKASDERYTPDSVWRIIEQVGRVAYDPCCGPQAPARAVKHAGANGLETNWTEIAEGGLVYVNPPFSELRKWAEKTVAEARAGASIVVLTPGDLGTRWAQTLLSADPVIAAWRGRIAFGGPTEPSVTSGSSKKAGAMFPTLFWCFGHAGFCDRFARVFRPHCTAILEPSALGLERDIDETNEEHCAGDCGRCV